MNKRLQRLTAIRNLINNESIASQEELLERLGQMNIDTTQSTLSRDIKEIRAVKVADPEKGYVYVLPQGVSHPNGTDRTASLISNNILSIEFSGNIAVIKTNPGYANAVAAFIDSIHLPQIMGSIAGDDSIFVALRENISKQELISEFKQINPTVTVNS